MGEVITFEDYRPSPRYDNLPWTSVTVEEGTASVGPWSLLETITFGTADPDPTNPAYRNFTTSLGGTAEGLWYRLTFLDGSGNTGLPTFPVQNLSTARPIYASLDELARLLRVSASQRHAALLRVLESAAQEIDDEIGTADINGNSLPYGSPPSLVQEVNLERAVEHWQQGQSPFGIIGLGDGASVYTARDSWDRHAHKLAPLKASWGIA